MLLATVRSVLCFHYKFYVKYSECKTTNLLDLRVILGKFTLISTYTEAHHFLWLGHFDLFLIALECLTFISIQGHWVRFKEWRVTQTTSEKTMVEVIWDLSCLRSANSVVTCWHIDEWQAAGWFDIKTPSYQDRNSHYEDEIVLRPSYL